MFHICPILSTIYNTTSLEECLNLIITNNVTDHKTSCTNSIKILQPSMRIIIQYNYLQYGLMSISSSDDDIRDVSNCTSKSQIFAEAGRIKTDCTLIKHGASPFIHKTDNNKNKIHSQIVDEILLFTINQYLQ